MQPIRAITLDLDDTLWEIAPVIRRAEAALWHWLDTHFPDISGHFTPDTASALRERIMSEHRDRSHDLRFLRKAVLGHMAETAGYGNDLVEPAFRVFDDARNCVDLFPDVLPALEKLAGRYRIIAVTNGNANLETIGIRRHFFAVVTAVDAGAAKPSAAIFECALEHAGVAPAETLHVGDSPEIDIVGAAGAGLATAWMNRRGDSWPRHLRRPDAVVTTFGELDALLDPAGSVRRVRRPS